MTERQVRIVNSQLLIMLMIYRLLVSTCLSAVALYDLSGVDESYTPVRRFNWVTPGETLIAKLFKYIWLPSENIPDIVLRHAQLNFFFLNTFSSLLRKTLWCFTFLGTSFSQACMQLDYWIKVRSKRRGYGGGTTWDYTPWIPQHLPQGFTTII